MCVLKNMLKRADLNSILSYLIDDTGSVEEHLDSYEKKIKDSYETIFEKLEKRYPEAEQQEDALFDIVADFSAVHDDIYFEIGVLVGFQLYKSLDEGYKNYAGDDGRGEKVPVTTYKE